MLLASILDLVADSAKRVNNKLGSEDRIMLGEYLIAVRQVEERTRRLDESLNVPTTARKSDEATRLQRKLGTAEAGEYYRLFCDLMVMALRTNSTRVITCGIGGEGNASGIPEIGIRHTRHGLSHHHGDPEQLRRLTETYTSLIGQLSYLPTNSKSARKATHRFSTPRKFAGEAAWPTDAATATPISQPSSRAARLWAASTALTSISNCLRSANPMSLTRVSAAS